MTAPSPSGPGKFDRRMLIAPIILPGTYPACTSNIQAWGVFFLIRAKFRHPMVIVQTLPDVDQFRWSTSARQTWQPLERSRAIQV